MQTTDPQLEIAFARGHRAAALIDERQWDEAAVELDLAREALSRHASVHPLEWAEYLAMVGLVALHRGDSDLGCQQLRRALDAALAMRENVAQTEVLDLASLLLVAKVEWQRDELLDLASRLRAYWTLNDATVASSALPVVGQLAEAFGLFGDAESKLMHELAGDAVRSLEAIVAGVDASVPEAKCLDWLLQARLDPKSQQRLRTVVTALLSTIGARSLDGRRLAAHLVALACRRGEALRAASLLEVELGVPLPVDSGLQSPFETVALQVLTLLQQKGQRARAKGLRPRIEAWLLEALGEECSDDAKLELCARLASAAGDRRTALYLLRRRVSLLEECEGRSSALTLDAVYDLFGELYDDRDAALDCLETGNSGLELARQVHGDGSEETAWWRGMLVFAHLRNGSLDDAATLAEEGARMLAMMSDQAAQRTIDAVTLVADSLERQGLDRRAAQLRRHLGGAS